MGGDIVPLSRRVAALCVLRLAGCVAVFTIAVAAGRLDSLAALTGPVIYVLAGTGIGGLVVSIPHRASAVAVFGLTLCLDGVAVQYAQDLLGTELGGDIVPPLFLAAVCLLASFRTGAKLAIWQSLLLVADQNGRASGLFATQLTRHPHRLLAELILIWLMVVVVCTAAAINERELRRRRYDAEVLQQLAARLHQDATAERVIQRMVQFTVDELDGVRVVAVQRTADGLSVLAQRGIRDTVPQPRSEPGAVDSALLDITSRVGQPARILQLDPARDPWLAARLPGARRLIVLPLATDPDDDRTWIVLEHCGRGVRLERRVLAAASQACATAGLALSRAVLFERSRAFARTDGLTGLCNRRGLDELLEQLDADRRLYAVILADVDHFKAVNDTHGHQTGDEVLCAFAAVLGASAPPEATVARYGGEEFAIVVVDDDLSTVGATAERLRLAVEQITEPVPITASFGVAHSGPERSAADIIADADAALYGSKRAGRNRVEVAKAPAVGPT